MEAHCARTRLVKHVAAVRTDLHWARRPRPLGLGMNGRFHLRFHACVREELPVRLPMAATEPPWTLPRTVGPGGPVRRQRGPLGRAEPEHPLALATGSVKLGQRGDLRARDLGCLNVDGHRLCRDRLLIHLDRERLLWRLSHETTCLAVGNGSERAASHKDELGRALGSMLARLGVSTPIARSVRQWPQPRRAALPAQSGLLAGRYLAPELPHQLAAPLL